MALHYNSPTLTLVVNPAAGGGLARRQLPHVTSELVAGMPEASLQVIQTSSFAEARLRCIAAVEQARPAEPGRMADSLLVMGGDGMMHLGLNAAANTDVPLGLIPAGTGNDFCRGVGIRGGVSGALRTIVSGGRRRIDLMSVSGALVDGAEQRWVGSILSTGFDSRVNYRANHQRVRLGGLAYSWAAITELSHFEPLQYRLVIDGVPREQSAMLIGVGNAGYLGGGMHGCPNADIEDGWLDLTIVHPVSRITMLRLLPTMFTGGFVKDPAVELLRAREVVVDGDGLYGMADGEEIGTAPLTCRVVPKALTVYAPGADDA